MRSDGQPECSFNDFSCEGIRIVTLCSETAVHDHCVIKVTHNKGVDELKQGFLLEAPTSVRDSSNEAKSVVGLCSDLAQRTAIATMQFDTHNQNSDGVDPGYWVATPIEQVNVTFGHRL